jgi:hypothetical protein
LLGQSGRTDQAQDRARRADVAGIFLNDELSLVLDAILMKHNDELAVHCVRYATLETIVPIIDNPFAILAAVAR